MPSRLQHCLLAACLGFAAIPSLAVDFGTPAIEVVDGAALKGIQRVAVTSFTVQYVLEQVWDTSYTSGGTNLGVGGLVRAYGGAAAECLRLGLRQPLLAMIELELACAFDDLGTVHAALQAHAAEKTGERYLADGAVLSLRLPTSQAAALQLRLRDATRDRIRFAAPATTEMH